MNSSIRKITLLAAGMLLSANICLRAQNDQTPTTPEVEEAATQIDVEALIKGATYMTAEEREVIRELNYARTKPQEYAQKVLTPFLKRFRPDGSYMENNMRNLTKEGSAAVQEAIDALMATEPLPALIPEEKLYKAAVYHTKDTGPKGLVQHDSSDGTSCHDRIKRFFETRSTGECMAFANNKARPIVIQMLVDDGVKSRGHRLNIMSPDYKYVGVNIGTHTSWKWLCTMDFAQ